MALTVPVKGKLTVSTRSSRIENQEFSIKNRETRSFRICKLEKNFKKTIYFSNEHLDLTLASSVRLSDLFLKRSLKQQAHLVSQLKTQFSKFLKLDSRIESRDARIETQGTVNVPLSGTVL